ncbi:MAG TPA: Fic family protein [Planctomycetota bacterium]|nr:Fic family protein [Planctomycetota bacterium]
MTELATEVVRASAQLGGGLHPLTQQSIASILYNMNSYYSNLIEGHQTRPRDIERALQNRLSKDQGVRTLQLEARAHIEVHKAMERRLHSEPELKISGSEFLRWLHREFYSRMQPDAGERASLHSPANVAGSFREQDVEVGLHIPPRWESLPAFMQRFEEVYSLENFANIERIIAAAAAHHRLTWIHPFIDGNGRVTRLFTQAYLIRCGVSGHGLWTISRGLARHRDRYFALLQSADVPRQGDYDGRGNLSERALSSFCEAFLEIALDQITFMRDSLRLDNLGAATKRYVAERRLHPRSERLLTTLLFQGSLSRGDAGELLGFRPVRARHYLKQMLVDGVLRSSSPKGPLQLNFPTHVAEVLFPRLFPAE